MIQRPATRLLEHYYIASKRQFSSYRTGKGFLLRLAIKPHFHIHLIVPDLPICPLYGVKARQSSTLSHRDTSPTLSSMCTEH
jgi:hypothetical protein